MGVEGGPPGIITPDGGIPQHGKELVVRRETCDLVQFMDCVPGHLEITTHHLFFLSSERRDGHSCGCFHGDWVTMVTTHFSPHPGAVANFKVRLDQLREIHSRRFNMQRTAIEIFLTDQTNYFLNFSSSKVSLSAFSISLGHPASTGGDKGVQQYRESAHPQPDPGWHPQTSQTPAQFGTDPEMGEERNLQL